MTALASKKMVGGVPFEVRKENPCTLCGDLGVVKAKQVVVAAGTLGSNAVLLRSKKQGLSLSDRVGHGFSGNGDMVVGVSVGTKDAAGDETGLDPKSGPSISVGSGFTTKGHHIVIEDLGSRPILQVIFGQGDTKDMKARTEELRYLGMGTAAADGEVYLGPSGGIKVRWPGGSSVELYDQMSAAMTQMSSALGAS